MSAWKKPIPILVAIIVLIGVGAAGFVLATRESGPVPAALQNELEFTPLVPKNADDIKSDRYKVSPKTDETPQTLSYVIDAFGATVTVSQYTQPKEFAEVPEYKQRFLDSAVKQYSSVPSASGVIYLGRASKSEQQIGVMLERGLLTFFNPSRELSEPEWRQIGDSLELDKR